MAHIHQGTVAGDAGIVHQHIDIAQIRRYRRHAILAGLEVTDIEFIGWDAGLFGKLRRRVIIAGVVGGD